MKGLSTYLSERFPLTITITLSLATVAIFVGPIVQPSVPNYFLKSAILAIGFFFFLLRQRITDEFKDMSHDGSHYPNRPVQRGVVNKNVLLQVGAIAFALEISAAMANANLMGNTGWWVFYLPFVGYSALLAAEFFVPKWLERHFNIYFLSHQAIFFMLWAWIPAIFALEFTSQLKLVSLGSILYMVVVEVARKYEIRLDADGKPVRDTYLTVWGKGISLAVVIASSSVATALFFWESSNLWLLIVQGLFLFSLLVLHRNPKVVQAIIFIGFVTQSGLVFFS